MLPTNFAAPSAKPGPAKEKVVAARANAATFVAVEIIFFISTHPFDGFSSQKPLLIYSLKRTFFHEKRGLSWTIYP
jgi:hypothetical protein